MNYEAFILKNGWRDPVAVILADSPQELRQKTIQALKNEVNAIGDPIYLNPKYPAEMGFPVSVEFSYVIDTTTINIDNFTLTKIIHY